MAAQRLMEKVEHTAEEVEDHYSDGTERPLGSYLGALTAYGALVAAAGAIARWRRVPLPDRIPAGDLALISVATHKLSRILAKDAVTSPLRAPFTQYREPAGAGELNEEVTASGPMHGVGELVSCPFCLGQWVATGFVAGLVFAPRATRLAAAVLAARTGSDVLQFAYARLQSAER